MDASYTFEYKTYIFRCKNELCPAYEIPIEYSAESDGCDCSCGYHQDNPTEEQTTP